MNPNQQTAAVWIKAQDGTLYNADCFRSIVLKQDGARWVIQASAKNSEAARPNELLLYTFTDKAEGEKYLTYLTFGLKALDPMTAYGS